MIVLGTIWMLDRKSFCYNREKEMAYFIFYAIFTSVILTTGNANPLSTTSTPESRTIPTHTTSSSSSNFTQTVSSAVTLSTGTTGVATVGSTTVSTSIETSTSPPVESEETEVVPTISDIASPGSTDVSEETDYKVSSGTRISNKSMIVGEAGEESVSVGTTESQHQTSQITTFQEIGTTEVKNVPSDITSEKRHRTGVKWTTENARYLSTTSTPESSTILTHTTSSSSSNFTQTDSSAVTLSTGTTGVATVGSTTVSTSIETSTSPPVESEETEVVPTISDIASPASTNVSEETDYKVSTGTRIIKTPIFVNESVDFGTTESQHLMSQTTAFEEIETTEEEQVSTDGFWYSRFQAVTDNRMPGGRKPIDRSMIAAASLEETGDTGAADSQPSKSVRKAAATGAAMNIVSPAKAYYALQLLALVMIRLVC